MARKADESANWAAANRGNLLAGQGPFAPERPHPTKLFFYLLLVLLPAGLAAADIEWHPDANMDSQLFPSLIIATATQRPNDNEDESEPDPHLLGDPYGAVGISITAPRANTKVRVTLLENEVMNKSTWSGVLEEAGADYNIAPKVNYKFDQLRKVRQQVPLNVTFEVAVNGKDMGEQTETLTLRTINDCPFGVSEAEETIDSEKGDDGEDADEEPAEESADSSETAQAPGGGGFTDLGWMFAAYVNENSPIVDEILKEALATKIVDSFAGYQKGPGDVVKELFAIWTALQKRGIKYSNITTTAGGSQVVYSQHVRFVDESVANEQANCVDGSVLFASILRKLGLRSFLVSVPGHMFMGFYLTADGDKRVALETTMIGSQKEQEAEALKEFKGLEEIRATLDKKMAESTAWKTFATAAAVGTLTLEQNQKKFEAGDNPQYQITDIDEARKDGIMPISYQKAE